ncbi:MAG: hypothetical protein WBE38_16770 [Terracidiphilus sp.]
MATMSEMKLNCTGMDTKLADLLLDPGSAPAKVQAHVADCEVCGDELRELKATMDLLDTWQVPEPSPYFMTRFQARLREESEAAPAGWLAGRIARLRAGFAYGPRTHARPLAAMALTVMLLVGGGTYLDLTDWNQPVQSPPQAAVVHDLQTLDSNAQLLDQMEALSTNDNGD